MFDDVIIKGAFQWFGGLGMCSGVYMKVFGLYVHPIHPKVCYPMKHVLSNAGHSKLEPEIGAFVHFRYKNLKIDKRF